MPRGKRVVEVGIGLVVVAMVLAGCASPAPAPTSSTPAPVVTPTPAFTSDADAVAAAKAFYEKYLDVANRIGESDAASVAPLRSFLSAAQYQSEASDLAKIRAQGQRLGGPAKVSAFKAQQVNAAIGNVDLYICLDLSKARLLNASGKDVTPHGRPSDTTLTVDFVNLPARSRIDSSRTWQGSPVC